MKVIYFDNNATTVVHPEGLSAIQFWDLQHALGDGPIPKMHLEYLQQLTIWKPAPEIAYPASRCRA